MSYIVGVEKIRDFASAIGDDNPLYHDRDAARQAGHADLVAPPTFGVAIITRAQDEVLFNPALGLDYSRVVHGDQRFVFRRPVVAGDELFCTFFVDSSRMVQGNEFLGLRTEVADPAGEPVLTVYGTLVVRGPDA
jgi:acyl dehydratase